MSLVKCILFNLFNFIFQSGSIAMVKIKNKGKRPQGKDGHKNTQAMQFNHALGQHILKNPLIVQALVEKVNLINW